MDVRVGAAVLLAATLLLAGVALTIRPGRAFRIVTEALTVSAVAAFASSVAMLARGVIDRAAGAMLLGCAGVVFATATVQARRLNRRMAALRERLGHSTETHASRR